MKPTRCAVIEQWGLADLAWHLADHVDDDAARAWAWIERGDVQQDQGDLAAALGSYRASLAIRERLAAADRGNAGWQRDVAVSNAKLGAACLANQDPAQARHFLLAGRAIMAGLVARYPDWVEWKRDLAWVDGQLAALVP